MAKPGLEFGPPDRVQVVLLCTMKVGRKNISPLNAWSLVAKGFWLGIWLGSLPDLSCLLWPWTTESTSSFLLGKTKQTDSPRWNFSIFLTLPWVFVWEWCRGRYVGDLIPTFAVSEMGGVGKLLKSQFSSLQNNGSILDWWCLLSAPYISFL